MRLDAARVGTGLIGRAFQNGILSCGSPPLRAYQTAGDAKTPMSQACSSFMLFGRLRLQSFAPASTTPRKFDTVGTPVIGFEGWLLTIEGRELPRGKPV